MVDLAYELPISFPAGNRCFHVSHACESNRNNGKGILFLKKRAVFFDSEEQFTPADADAENTQPTQLIAADAQLSTHTQPALRTSSWPLLGACSMYPGEQFMT